jgi:predicted DNA-binding transcriptional regulator AlpA
MKSKIDIQNRAYVSAAIIIAEYGISAPTFYRWLKRGLLPQPVKLGPFRYYDKAETEARLAKGE